MWVSYKDLRNIATLLGLNPSKNDPPNGIVKSIDNEIRSITHKLSVGLNRDREEPPRLSNTVDVLLAKIRNQKSTIKQKTAQLAESKEENAALNSENTRVASETKTLETKLQLLTRQFNVSQVNVTTLGTLLNDLKRRNSALDRELHDVNNRLGVILAQEQWKDHVKVRSRSPTIKARVECIGALLDNENGWAATLQLSTAKAQEDANTKVNEANIQADVAREEVENLRKQVDQANNQIAKTRKQLEIAQAEAYLYDQLVESERQSQSKEKSSAISLSYEFTRLWRDIRAFACRYLDKGSDNVENAIAHIWEYLCRDIWLLNVPQTPNSHLITKDSLMGLFPATFPATQEQITKNLEEISKRASGIQAGLESKKFRAHLDPSARFDQRLEQCPVLFVCTEHIKNSGCFGFSKAFTGAE